MNKVFLLFFACILIVNAASAQGYSPSNINKKAVQQYNKAVELIDANNFPAAIQAARKATDIDPKYGEAYILQAHFLADQKDYTQSCLAFEKAFQIDSTYFSNELVNYATSLAGIGEFLAANNAIDIFIDKTNPTDRTTLEHIRNKKKSLQFAIEFDRAHPDARKLFQPKNAGPEINSIYSEYFPSLPIDGKQIVFTRRAEMYNEDFFESKRDIDSNWEKAMPLAGSLNTNQSEGALQISQDGEWIVFTGCYRPDTYGSCDLYISFKTKNGWSPAQNLGPTINSDQWDSQPCLSPDKKDLYFTSRRMGGYGGADIYVSHLMENGRWTDPENLGPTINTSGDEQCPFIHADNQTLYFSSSKWQGYGDEDIFLSRKNLLTGKWSAPENLGYPINTIDREGTLFVTADGKTAYYASERSDSYGGLDIYSFELRNDIRPTETRWVKGKIIDKKTNRPIEAVVKLFDIASKNEITNIYSDDAGEFLLTLPSDKEYIATVDKKGYLFYTESFHLKNNTRDSALEKNIYLEPIQINAAIQLNNVLFKTNSSELDSISYVELNTIVQLLNENPGIKIEIRGHTDNIGKADDNLKLSEKRAHAVVDYLIQKNISPTRLQAKGFGETLPLVDNTTEEGRSKNRRTELLVIQL